MEQKYKSGIDFVKLIREELAGIVAKPLDISNKDLSLQNGKEINHLKQSGIKVFRRGLVRRLGENYLEISVPESSEFAIKYVMQQLVARLAPKGFQIKFVDYDNPENEFGMMAFSRLDSPKCVTLLKIIDHR